MTNKSRKSNLKIAYQTKSPFQQEADNHSNFKFLWFSNREYNYYSKLESKDKKKRSINDGIFNKN